MTPFPWVALILPQRLVLPDLQNLHSLHSGVLVRSSAYDSEEWQWEERELTKEQQHNLQALRK